MAVQILQNVTDKLILRTEESKHKKVLTPNQKNARQPVRIAKRINDYPYCGKKLIVVPAA